MISTFGFEDSEASSAGPVSALDCRPDATAVVEVEPTDQQHRSVARVQNKSRASSTQGSVNQLQAMCTRCFVPYSDLRHPGNIQGGQEMQPMHQMLKVYNAP